MRFRWLSCLLMLIGVMLLAPGTGRAARDQAVVAPSLEVQELVVLEAPNCVYCGLFRRDVLPGYKQSKRATELPIRFLDLNDPAADKLKLKASITIVPTAVLLRQGEEAGRISGYTGPEAFFHSVSRLLGQSD